MALCANMPRRSAVAGLLSPCNGSFRPNDKAIALLRLQQAVQLLPLPRVEILAFKLRPSPAAGLVVQRLLGQFQEHSLPDREISYPGDHVAQTWLPLCGKT